MSNRGSFDLAIKPGARKMPKGRPYKEKDTKSAEKKESKKGGKKMPFQPKKASRKVSV